jgi:predicted O-methyltransferase YrrM
MLSKKLQKFIKISRAFINEKKELKKIAAIDTKNSITSALAYCKRPSPEDKEVFKELENYRSSLLHNKTKVTYEVFNSSKTSDISTICKKAASPREWCHLFYYLTKFSNAEHVLEMGTNLGVSGQYFLASLSGKEGASFVSMEAHPHYCQIARERFKEVAPEVKTRVVEGFYKDTLDGVLNGSKKFDLVFIDGHHVKDATLKYFHKIKPHLNEGALIIFDDINWSNEMQEVWEIVKMDPEVILTVDFYKLGILVYNPSENTPAIHSHLFLSF